MTTMPSIELRLRCLRPHYEWVVDLYQDGELWSDDLYTGHFRACLTFMKGWYAGMVYGEMEHEHMEAWEEINPLC